MMCHQVPQVDGCTHFYMECDVTLAVYIGGSRGCRRHVPPQQTWYEVLHKMDCIVILVYCSILKTENQTRPANILVTKPYQNWKDAKSDLKTHSVTDAHVTATAKREAFMQHTRSHKSILIMS